MKVSGYGEFQQLRKLVQKDEQQQGKDKAANNDNESLGLSGSDSDAVQISPTARRKARIRAASDFREAKVAEVREKLESGTLLDPESVRGGVSKMLNSLVSGDL